MNYEMRSAEAVSSFSGHYQSSSNVDEVLTAPPAPKKRRVKVKVVEPVQALEPEAKVLQHLEPEAKVIVPEANALETNEAAAEIKKLIQYEEDVQKKVEAAIRDTSEEEKVLLDHIGSFVEEPYHIIESYFAGQHLERLVRHQIESYNHFVNYQIQRTIQMFNPVTIRSENDYVADIDKYFLEIQVAFSNFKLYPPQIHENNGATKMMLPQEAKLRNFTYASTMNVDINIKYIVRTSENMETPRIIEKTLPKINIGKLPIMLKSSICVLSQNKHISNDYTGECSMDSGGYFIIKGSEKTVLGQERAAENRVYCFDGKNTTKWSWFAEIKSVPDFKCISPKQIEMMVASKNNGFGHGIFITVPRIKNPIELYVLFRALGIISDKDITKYIMLDIGDEKKGDVLQFLQASIIDANKYMTQEDALRHITASVAYTPLNLDKEVGARKKREFTVDVLDNDLFPHCQTLQQKLYMVGYMANKLIQTSLGWLPPDDRDSYINKRIELTGTLLNNLFRNYFNKLVKEMQKQVVREINNGSWRSTDDYESIINMTNIYKIMKSTTIENGINRALSTGDFSIKQSNSSKVGVAQVLNRLTYVSSLSHLRRINTPLEKSGELIAPRKLHGTTLGFLCCLTGDAEILLSNRLDTCPIRDIRDGDCVNTVHRSTLVDEPSDMKNFFCKTPDKLYEITTISGRTIKATGDHPFLINMGSGFEMVPVSRLHIGDKMVIRHTVKAIRDEADATTPLNSLNKPIPLQTFKLIARIFGYMFGRMSDTVSFGEECDAVQFVEDLEALGFERVQVVEVAGENWTVQLSQGVQEFITNIWDPEVDPRLPEWLIDAEPSVKREFLSGFQGRNGSTVRNVPNGADSAFRVVSSYSTGALNVMTYALTDVCVIFGDIGIKCHVNFVDEGSNTIYMIIDDDLDNMCKYGNLIAYAYCDKKRRDSALAIETVLCLSSGRIIPLEHLIEPLRSGCVSVPILSIREVPVEPVYDFTTYSDNHSFVASSFVSSNCAETPEGQSIGIVKNISYMAHITIPTNSASLYEYVNPHVLSVNDCRSEDLNDKVKVFVNGCWLGVTDDPVKLYHEMKDKKYRGIINIYTSIIFDIKMMEIRICNDGGRLTRPLLRVRNNQALITKDIIERLTRHELSWNDLLTNCRLEESVVEYIDPDEQNLAMIAMKCKDTYLHCMTGQRYRFTHCEIHPSTIFGVVASCVPYPDHNQAPRNTYQCLHPDELVWMADGTKVPIKDVKIGDDVLTFHPETLEITETKVVNQFVRPNEFPIYRLTTVSGKEIRATEDHKFMTNMGWKTVNEMMCCHYFDPCFYDEESKKFYYEKWGNFEQEPDGLISCIETESDNHSFLTTNGAAVKNCAMGKQAMGVYATNYDQRMDKTAYILNYPSRPLVETRIMNIIRLNQIPSGCQIHVAIMTHTGYNQEDSVLINKGSIDRGLFMATIYHTEKDEDKNIIRDEIIRCKPDPTKTKGIKFGNYDKLNSQGFIPENSLVENRDVIIAKTIPIKENRNDPTKTVKYEDQSKTFRTTEETYIDKNFTGRNGDGYNFAKVRVRTLRKPVLGDKFSSRHGQKGTVGNIIPECDMPFTKDGLRPDIIINPHAIPSRMTIGQLKETLLGKVLLELGMFGDGTSFGNLDVKTISKELQKLGYESYGNELMYNGLTGEQLETNIYIGPVFYQRLKHMVNDKQHSRSIGPMVNLTRQPAEGRSRDGGFRIGEMERDVMLAHGMSRFCKERMFDVSDKYSVHVCKKCGMVASYNDGNKNKMYASADFSIHMCRTCDNKTDFALVNMPYAYKLLAQELQTINVVPRILT